MSLSRREFLRVTGMATLTAALPLGLGRKSALAASPPPGLERYTARVMGANVKVWTFDQSRTVRQRQIQQVVGWGFECLRDNDVFGSVPTYDLYHAGAVAEELGEQGVDYLFTGADRTPGMEELIPASAWAAIRERYPYIGDARRCLTSIAAGAGMTSVTEFMLDKVAFLRGIMPSNARMQAFNGPELEGYLKWNMYDHNFRAWVRSIGLPAPDPVDDPAMRALVRQNYDNFKNAMKSIWGDNWVYDSSHVYVYDGANGPGVYYYPWPSGHKVLTEVGVSRVAVQDPAYWFGRVLFDVVQYYASRGLEWLGADRYMYNVEEFYIHSAVDPRFLDLWLSGQTEVLWNPQLYRQLVEGLNGSNREGLPEYDAVMMDESLAAAVLNVMQTFRNNRGTYEPQQPEGGGGQDSFGGELDSALGGAGGQSVERGYGTGTGGAGGGIAGGATPKGTPTTPVEKLGGGR